MLSSLQYSGSQLRCWIAEDEKVLLPAHDLVLSALFFGFECNAGLTPAGISVLIMSAYSFKNL